MVGGRCYKTLGWFSSRDSEPVKEWGVQISNVPGEILLEDVAPSQEHVHDCVQS